MRRRTPLATISAEVINAVASDEPTPDALVEKADLRRRVRQALRPDGLGAFFLCGKFVFKIDYRV